MSSNWDNKYYELAEYVSSWSKDNSTKVGAVLTTDDNRVISFGFNGFPRGVNDDIESRHERPIKYKFTEHSERNAIYNATFLGLSLKNSKMYVTSFPCSDCARAIIQSGIKEIIVKENQSEDYISRWGEDIKISIEMFNEANVKITYIN